MSHVNLQNGKLTVGLGHGLLLQWITLVVPGEHLEQREIKSVLEVKLTHR